MQKRSMSDGATTDCGANKSRKLRDSGHQWRTLNFQGHPVVMIFDDRGIIWFSWLDIVPALDIHAVLNEVYDFCARNKYIRKLSELGVSDRSITLPGNALFIVAKGVVQMESRLVGSRVKQFTKSILGANIPEKLAVINELRAPRTQAEVEKEELARRDESGRQRRAALEEEDKVWSVLFKSIRQIKSELARLQEPTEIVYIATCKRYALQNKFKVGGVKSVDLLEGRLAVMNMARAPADLLYYCLWLRCSNHRRVQQSIVNVIGKHRVQPDDTYNLHYSALKEVVVYLSKRVDEKNMFDSLIRKAADREPVVPRPWILHMNQRLQAHAGTDQHHNQQQGRRTVQFFDGS